MRYKWRDIQFSIPDIFFDETDYVFADTADLERVEAAVSSLLPDKPTLEDFVNGVKRRIDAFPNQDGSSPECQVLRIYTGDRVTFRLDYVRRMPVPQNVSYRVAEITTIDSTVYFMMLSNLDYIRICYRAPRSPDATQRKAVFIAELESANAAMPAGQPEFRVENCGGQSFLVPELLSTNDEFNFSTSEHGGIEARFEFRDQFSMESKYEGVSDSEEGPEFWENEFVVHEMQRFHVKIGDLFGTLISLQGTPIDGDIEDRYLESHDLFLPNGSRVLGMLSGGVEYKGPIHDISRSIIHSYEVATNG